MNYVKLYARFIQSRLEKPLDSGLYGERHHIKPKCLGGGNEKTNIIRLSPEDHFFAHVLLTKAYGGKLWAPLARMAKSVNKSKIAPTRRMRRMYAHLREQVSLAASGENNQKADLAIYHFVHRTGREFVGTRHAFARKEGLSAQFVLLVVNKRYKAKGDWSTHEKVNTPGFFWGKMRGKHHYAADQTIYEWHHKDGRIEFLTSFDLAEKYEISTKLTREVVRGSLPSAHGWRTISTPPDTGTITYAISNAHIC